MNVAVAVQASLGEELILLRCSIAAEAVLQGVGPGGMSETGVVARLTELRRLVREKVVAIAPVRLMAYRAILRDGWMLKRVRPSLFLMTLVAKIRYGISAEHGLAKTPVRLVAIRALYLALGNGVVGLSAYLVPDLFVTGNAKGRFPRLEVVATT
jgi:hypothetical protein